MTDFHTSLDWALAEHPYRWSPPVDRSIVDSFVAHYWVDGWGGWDNVPLCAQQVPAEGTE